MNALPSMRQLRYFVALADSLNFTRAAEVCFVSQSTLSSGLKELETTLDLQLFERDRQSVALTEQGEFVLARAKQLLASAEDLMALAKTTKEPMKGMVRIGVIPTIAPFELSRFMPTLRKRYPQLKVALREDLTENLLDRLRERKIDMALIALPYDTKGLIVEELFTDRLMLVGSSDDTAITSKKSALTSQIAERLLLLEEGYCLRDHSLQACGGGEFSNTSGIEATSLLTLIQMVASGLGLALVPEMAIRAGLLTGTSLQSREVDKPQPFRTIALATRPTSPFIREFDVIAKIITQCHRPSN